FPARIHDHKHMSLTGAASVYASFAVGVLAKGPVAFVLPTAVIGAYFLIAHRKIIQTKHQQSIFRRAVRMLVYFFWTCWRMRPVTAMLMLLVIAVPWYAWVGYRTNGEFLREFFLEHNLNRARQPLEGHSGPIFFYLIAILPGFFPWSVFLVPTMWHAVAA